MPAEMTTPPHSSCAAIVLLVKPRPTSGSCILRAVCRASLRRPLLAYACRLFSTSFYLDASVQIRGLGIMILSVDGPAIQCARQGQAVLLTGMQGCGFAKGMSLTIV